MTAAALVPGALPPPGTPVLLRHGPGLAGDPSTDTDIFGVCLLPPAESRASFRLGLLTSSDQELVAVRDAIRATIEGGQVAGRDLLFAWSLFDILDWELQERSKLRGQAAQFWGTPAKWSVRQLQGIGGVVT